MRSQLRHSTRQNFAQAKLRWGRTKPNISAEYIVGLTDREGCFYVLLKQPFNKKGGARVELSFLVKMQERDKELLENVRKNLGCGAVYFQHEKRANHTQCYRYTVNSHRDIVGKIIPFFQTHPLQSSSKQRSFWIFCEIAQMVQEGKHLTKSGFEEIRRLKERMNNRTRVVREIRMLRPDVKSGSRSQDIAHRLGNAK